MTPTTRSSLPIPRPFSAWMRTVSPLRRQEGESTRHFGCSELWRKVPQTTVRLSLDSVMNIRVSKSIPGFSSPHYRLAHFRTACLPRCISEDPISVPHLARYIREETTQPSLLIKLMLVADAVLSDLNRRIEQGPLWKSEASISYLNNAHKIITIVSNVIFLSSPPTSYIPDITSPAASFLRRSIQQLLVNITTQSATTDNDAQFENLREAVDATGSNLFSFLKGECEHAPCVKLRKEYRDEQPWKSCAGSELGECKKMGEGQEMMACGRCKQLRYCSPAHQKAHWKQHKKTCWESIW